MNKLEKINRINEVGKKIWYRDGDVKLTEQEAENFDTVLKSDLPILMFLLDNTDVPVLGEHRMEYIYYLPDLDQIRCESVYLRKEDYDTYKVEEYFLPDTLDLRKVFAGLTINGLFESSKVTKETHLIFMISLEILKNNIDEIFKTNNIKSWEEVRSILVKDLKDNKELKLERAKD